MAGETAPPGTFIGTSPCMQAIYGVIESAAASRASVFITGESGTGKDVCAQAIHHMSPRSAGPFVALNCAAIPAGLLESELFGHVKGAFTGAIDHRDGAVRRAQGGTLFLDEICDMGADMQAKLLRFLQTLSYTRLGGNREEQADVRIICATNRDPQADIEQGRFRDDLYYRLHVIPIAMPALRGRTDDILDLADYYLAHFARQEGKHFTGFTADAETFLVRYGWPGNVRELQNLIHSMVVLQQGPCIDGTMLEQGTRRSSSRPTLPAGPSRGAERPLRGLAPLWQVERETIENAIRLCGGNIPKAAAILEVSPSTIYRKKLSWEGKA